MTPILNLDSSDEDDNPFGEEPIKPSPKKQVKLDVWLRRGRKPDPKPASAKPVSDRDYQKLLKDPLMTSYFGLRHAEEDAEKLNTEASEKERDRERAELELKTRLQSQLGRDANALDLLARDIITNLAARGRSEYDTSIVSLASSPNSLGDALDMLRTQYRGHWYSFFGCSVGRILFLPSDQALTLAEEEHDSDRLPSQCVAWMHQEICASDNARLIRGCIRMLRLVEVDHGDATYYNFLCKLLGCVGISGDILMSTDGSLQLSNHQTEVIPVVGPRSLVALREISSFIVDTHHYAASKRWRLRLLLILCCDYYLWKSQSEWLVQDLAKMLNEFVIREAENLIFATISKPKERLRVLSYVRRCHMLLVGSLSKLCGNLAVYFLLDRHCSDELDMCLAQGRDATLAKLIIPALQLGKIPATIRDVDETAQLRFKMGFLCYCELEKLPYLEGERNRLSPELETRKQMAELLRSGLDALRNGNLDEETVTHLRCDVDSCHNSLRSTFKVSQVTY